MGDYHSTHLEEWRAIPGFNGYEASSLGRVRSIERIVEFIGRYNKLWRRLHKARILKQIRRGLYWRVDLGRGNAVSVHIAVALAFLGLKPFSNAVILHIDDDGLCNLPGNLVWGTYAKNSAMMVDHARQNFGEGVHTSKISLNDAVSIFNSKKKTSFLVARYGVSASTIRRIRSGKNWRIALARNESGNEKYRGVASAQ